MGRSSLLHRPHRGPQVRCTMGSVSHHCKFSPHTSFPDSHISPDRAGPALAQPKGAEGTEPPCPQARSRLHTPVAPALFLCAFITMDFLFVSHCGMPSSSARISSPGAWGMSLFHSMMCLQGLTQSLAQSRGSIKFC